MLAQLRPWHSNKQQKTTKAMKNTLFLTLMAAALLGGQVFAEPVVYKVSESSGRLNITAPEAKIIVDAPNSLSLIISASSECLTLDYQGDFVLTASMYLDTPDRGVLNITSTVGAVKTKWEETFSVEGGGSITLCSAQTIQETHGPVQFFSTDANNTVKLGDSEVLFKGLVASKDALAMNEVGVVWGLHDMLLVGKVQKSVPEPTTGTLSLLALAGLCARRRK